MSQHPATLTLTYAEIAARLRISADGARIARRRHWARTTPTWPGARTVVMVPVGTLGSEQQMRAHRGHGHSQPDISGLKQLRAEVMQLHRIVGRLVRWVESA